MGKLKIYRGVDINEFYDKFLQELMAWYEDFQEPSTGNQDLKNYLTLQEERMKKKVISSKIDLIPRDETSL